MLVPIFMLIPFDYLFKKYQIKSTFVLHLGANTGQEAEAYKAQGVHHVIWIEAIPEVFTQLARNIARYPNSVALCACLSDKDGQMVTFNVSSNDAQSSSFLEFGTHAKEHPTVKFTKTIQLVTSRVDTLLNQHNIQLSSGGFLNIDLQGAELLALIGIGDLLTRFDYIYVEVNTAELYKGCPHAEEIDSYLFEYGFVGIETKMTNHGWGDKFYMRRKIAKE